MNSWKQLVALLLVGCLVTLPMQARSASQVGAVRPDPGILEGASVKVSLVDGKTLEGLVEAADENGFLLASKGAHSSTRIEYHQVAKVRLPRPVYRSSVADPGAVRRVALTLGIGHHVLARVAAGPTYRGHIQAIEADHLALLLDHDHGVMQVPFSEIRHLEQNLSRGAKLAIILGAVGGTILIIVLYAWALSDLQTR